MHKNPQCHSIGDFLFPFYNRSLTFYNASFREDSTQSGEGIDRGVFADDRARIQHAAAANISTVTEDAARVFAHSGLCLLGNEGQTVGPEDAPMLVHKLLLQQQIALLEGIVLTGIPEGTYFLSAAPLKLAGADGAPCRACLIEF